MMQFTKATKATAKARIAIIGPAGSGKTYTALLLASGLGDKVALIDTERGSASKYAGKFDFDVLEPENHHPNVYIEAIEAAEKAGYDVLIIDSLSHAWVGKNGALEIVDRAASQSKSGNSYVAWRTVTPLHNALVDAMISARLHVIATMRSKMDYIQTKDDQDRTIIKKVGMQPIQRDGVEYEFDIVGDIDLAHNLAISKTRFEALDGLVVERPGLELAGQIRDWLTDGKEALQPEPDSKPKRQPKKPKPQAPPKRNGNGGTMNPQRLFELVQGHTNNYYQNLVHLCQTIGGKWPDFSDQDEVDSAISMAVDHAAIKKGEVN